MPWIIISECDEPDQMAEDNLKQSVAQIPNGICKTLIFFFPLFADRIKKNSCLTILVVIALIFSITGIGVWIASAVLLYSKFIYTTSQRVGYDSQFRQPTHSHACSNQVML